MLEAKKRSTPLPLRGDRGILAMLEASMTNRNASLAIAVASDDTAFTKEVGVFNNYDDNKLLCCLGAGGELLEVAYRWARATLLTDTARSEGIDVTGDCDRGGPARIARAEPNRRESQSSRDRRR